MSNFACWWFDAEVTPVLIPNTEVKLGSGDGTRKGRVASRQHIEFDAECPDLQSLYTFSIFISQSS